MNNHIMLDLETLGTGRNSVIVSIGAVRFDPTEVDGAMDPVFYVEFDKAAQKEQQAHGMRIDAATVNWWMQQDVLARRVFDSSSLSPYRTNNNREALAEFKNFYDEVADTLVWGNGSDFDNVLLGDMYSSFGINIPWSYSKNRCYRTLRGLPGAPKRLHHYGVQHNARDDAITQAQHLQEIYAWLRLSE